MVAKSCYYDLTLSRILTCEWAKSKNMADTCMEELLLYVTSLRLVISMEAESTRCSQEIIS
jgi:hypothetical protein